jgi:hypothetical protein
MAAKMSLAEFYNTGQDKIVKAASVSSKPGSIATAQKHPSATAVSNQQPISQAEYYAAQNAAKSIITGDSVSPEKITSQTIQPNFLSAAGKSTSENPVSSVSSSGTKSNGFIYIIAGIIAMVFITKVMK